MGDRVMVLTKMPDPTWQPKEPPLSLWTLEGAVAEPDVDFDGRPL
jgi:hypothetical protein